MSGGMNYCAADAVRRASPQEPDGDGRANNTMFGSYLGRNVVNKGSASTGGNGGGGGGGGRRPYSQQAQRPKGVAVKASPSTKCKCQSLGHVCSVVMGVV